MTKRQGIQLAYPFEERRLTEAKFAWTPPYICQPKLDGERCRVEPPVYISEQPSLLSSELNTFNFAVPHIVEQLRDFYIDIWSDCPELDGELYKHGLDFEEINSIVSRKKNLHPRHEEIEYHIFDLVDLETPQSKRLKEVKNLGLDYFPNLKIVPITLCWSVKEVWDLFEEYISLGYEGIIVRHFSAKYVRRRSTFMMKFKPKKTDIWPIVGWVEGNGKYKGTIGAIVCKTDQEEFEVGSFSLTDEKRMELWNKRDDLHLFDCKVGYQHKWASGKPKSGVFYELVERQKEPEFFNPLGGF